MASASNRRHHRKSRKGCLECKRRHIKCDETHPICLSCANSERQCNWASSTRNNSNTGVTPVQPLGPSTAATSTAADATPDKSPPVSNDIPDPVPSEAAVNLDHLELFRHFYTETCKTLVKTEDQVEIYRDLVVQLGFEHPFLMFQILAFSALHLGLCRPLRRHDYGSMAMSLQSKAVEGFTGMLSRVDASNCVVVLLSSHLIALHVFRDIFASLKTDFNAFMDGLVGCLRLLQGVNVVINTWGKELSQSKLGSIMMEAEERAKRPKVSFDECSPLRQLIASADLSPASINACSEAVDKLQQSFDIDNAFPGGPKPTTNTLFAWLVTASTEYTELLDKRRPEALVILAYYSVLLHRRRGSWVVGNAGQRLIDSLKTPLGRGWAQYLAWPDSVINEGRFSVDTPVSAAS